MIFGFEGQKNRVTNPDMKIFTCFFLAAVMMLAESVSAVATVETKTTVGESAVMIEVRDQSDLTVDSFRVHGRIRLEDGSFAPFNSFVTGKTGEWASISISAPSRPAYVETLYVLKLRADTAIRVR